MYELQNHQVSNQSNDQNGQDLIHHEEKTGQIIDRLHPTIQGCQRHG